MDEDDIPMGYGTHHQLKRIEHKVDQLIQLVEQLSRPPIQPIRSLIVINTSVDQPDVVATFTEDVTDDKGNVITDAAVLASLVKTFESDNPDVIAVSAGADANSFNCHWTGKPGAVSLKAVVAKPDGTVLGAGVQGVTVSTGAPSAVTNFVIKVGDLVDTPPAPTPAP